MEMYSYIHSYVIPVLSKQVMLWLYIPYILVHICCCALVYSAWYVHVVPGTTSLLSYQPVIPVTPGAIRGHITTKLHELKTVLDAGRGGWRA